MNKKKKILIAIIIAILTIILLINITYAEIPDIPAGTTNESTTAKIINIALGITQVVVVIVPIIMLIVGAIRAILLKIELKYEEDENNINSVKEIQEKLKKRLKAYIVFLIIGFCVSGLIQNIKTFAVEKPVIYIYPETSQEVTVKLGRPDILTCSYPKYETSWNVYANPDGSLVDLKTNNKLYSLYWEGKNTDSKKITEGFCVKGEDSAKFLEEKLDILGLNYKEKEEFIIYWLPRLEKNKYNLIRFETIDEINKNMPLEITPTPDTLIRVMMEFKGTNSYKELPEQQLESVERKGFVVVEWGGTEL